MLRTSQMDADDFLDTFLDEPNVSRFLPTEIMTKIATYLRFDETVLSFGLLTESFHRATTDPELWKQYYLDTFCFLEEEDNQNWFEKFRDRWIGHSKLSHGYLRSIQVNNTDSRFGMLCSNGSYLAVHDCADAIGLDVVHVIDLDRLKERSISPNMESTPACTLASRGSLIVGMFNGEAHFINFKTLNTTRLIQSKVSISAIADDPTRGLVALGHVDDTFSLWDSSNRLLGKIHVGARVTHLEICTSHVIVGTQQSFKVFKLPNLELVYVNMCPVLCWTINPTQEFIYYSEGHVVHFFSIHSLEETIHKIDYGPHPPPNGIRGIISLTMNSQWLIALTDFWTLLDPCNMFFIHIKTKQQKKPMVPSHTLCAMVYQSFFIVTGHAQAKVCFWDANGNLLRSIRSPHAFKEMLCVDKERRFPGIIALAATKLFFLEWIQERQKEPQDQMISRQRSLPGEMDLESPEETKKTKGNFKDQLKQKKQKLNNFWK